MTCLLITLVWHPMCAGYLDSTLAVTYMCFYTELYVYISTWRVCCTVMYGRCSSRLIWVTIIYAYLFIYIYIWYTHTYLISWFMYSPPIGLFSVPFAGAPHLGVAGWGSETERPFLKEVTSTQMWASWIGPAPGWGCGGRCCFSYASNG